MTEKDSKKLIAIASIALATIVLAMFVLGLLHLNRYWICAKPQYRAAAFCLYEFPLD